MAEKALIAISIMAVLGVAGQWFAWRLRQPAILFLLGLGLLVGPVLGVLDPDEVFGELIFPFVSLSVAVILFEGGLSLKLSELRSIGRDVANLVTIGVVVSFVLTTIFAHLLLDLPSALCWLLGSILVVTGPTVIIPLLRQVRPSGDIGALLKWEGIVIDPIGVILCVLCFEAISSSGFGAITGAVFAVILKAGLLGTLFGVAGALCLIILLRRYLIPII